MQTVQNWQIIIIKFLNIIDNYLNSYQQDNIADFASAFPETRNINEKIQENDSRSSTCDTLVSEMDHDTLMCDVEVASFFPEG